jgi:hypothetical protein
MASLTTIVSVSGVVLRPSQTRTVVVPAAKSVWKASSTLRGANVMTF